MKILFQNFLLFQREEPKNSWTVLALLEMLKTWFWATGSNTSHDDPMFVSDDKQIMFCMCHFAHSTIKRWKLFSLHVDT